MIRLAAFLLVAASLTGCGKKQDRDCGSIEMPPAQYMGVKTAARILWAPAMSIDATCRSEVASTNEKGPFTSCTGRDVLGWFHIMPKDGTVRDIGCLLIHEDAHLPPNPWPWDHPGGYRS